MTGAADGDRRALQDSPSAAAAATSGAGRAGAGQPTGSGSSADSDPASNGHTPLSEGRAPPSSDRESRQGSNRVDVTLARLEGQIAWYDARARKSQRWFKLIKLAELVLAAGLPVLAVFGFPWGTEATAVMGATLVILQGVEQLFQFQQNWITYRTTCEQLKHEKYLFHAGAGPYSRAQRPAKRLADRIEGLISQEHSKWVENREEAGEQLENVGAS